jgi:hypothetical protein
MKGAEDYCRGNWVQNVHGTLLCGSLKDVYGVNVSLNIVLLSHNGQEPVSWRREEEEGYLFYPNMSK